MRTFGMQHTSFALTAALTAALAASLAGAAVAPLAAQQQAADAPPALLIPTRCTDAACGGDSQLAIVSALYPYYDGTVRGPGVLTLVIENRGRSPAPISTLAVAPLARFASYGVGREARVDALMPGERTVVEIPLQLDENGGAPCISISVSPGIAPTRAQQFYASAAPAASAPAAPAPAAPAPAAPAPAAPAPAAPAPAASTVEASFGPPPFVSFIGDEGY